MAKDAVKSYGKRERKRIRKDYKEAKQNVKKMMYKTGGFLEPKIPNLDDL